MTLTRRLAAVEASATPTQRVVAWLEEAHAFGTLEAYVDSILDLPGELYPLNRLARDAVAAARAETARRSPDVVDKAVRKTLRATVFRFELVLRINVTAHSMMDREVLIYAALSSQLALLATEDRAERRADETHLRRLGQCRDAAFMRLGDLLAEQQARASVEARYLDGHPALFPAAVTAWDETLRQTTELVVMADRLAELDGAKLAAVDGDEPTADLVERHLNDLVEPARSTTLEKLDEGRDAIRVASGWLRSRRRPEPTVEAR
jgi:hypothetical protein